jgi:membrane protease subunit HflC
VACIALVTYLVVFQVRVNQVAVHYRWGGVERVINAGNQNEAGWYFKAPWPVDRVTKYDKRVHVLDSRLSQTQLKDNWNVIVSTFAGWRITNPVQFRRSLKGDVGTAEKNLQNAISDATSEVLGSQTIGNLVSTNEKKLQFDSIEQKISNRISKNIQENGYGLELNSFGIKRVALPQSTTEDVMARMRAERNKHATEYTAEGKSRKAELIQEAESKKQKMIADARASAKNIMAEGEAEAAKYYDTFARAPEFSIFLRRLESLDKIARQAAENKQPITFVLDTKTEPFGLLKQGPLEESGKIGQNGDSAAEKPKKETGDK